MTLNSELTCPECGHLIGVLRQQEPPKETPAVVRVRRWLLDCPWQGKMQASDAYRAFCEWNENGLDVTSAAFGRAMIALGVRREATRTGRFYHR